MSLRDPKAEFYSVHAMHERIDEHCIKPHLREPCKRKINATFTGTLLFKRYTEEISSSPDYMPRHVAVKSLEDLKEWALKIDPSTADDVWWTDKQFGKRYRVSHLSDVEMLALTLCCPCMHTGHYGGS